MRHAYRYGGAFELNYPQLQQGTSTYQTTDGDIQPLPPWPAEADGIRVTYMEKSGKKFYAVRIQYEDDDIVLETPQYIDPLRHMGNRRFSAEPTVVTDDLASAFLDDVIANNPDNAGPLGEMIARINILRRSRRG